MLKLIVIASLLIASANTIENVDQSYSPFLQARAVDKLSKSVFAYVKNQERLCKNSGNKISMSCH